MSDHSSDKQSILHRALSIQSPEDRTAYLQSACGGDDGLYNHLKALLDLQEPTADQVDYATDVPCDPTN